MKRVIDLGKAAVAMLFVCIELFCGMRRSEDRSNEPGPSPRVRLRMRTGINLSVADYTGFVLYKREHLASR